MKKTPLLMVMLGIAMACQSACGQDSSYVESVRCVGGPYGLKLPMDARKIRSLGRLLSEEIDEVERGDGYTASRKTLLFDGLELGVVEFSNDPARLMITRASMTKSSWNRLAAFKLGRPTKMAQALLGDHAQGDDELERSYGGDADSVQIHSSSGVVVRVSYSCYSG